MLATYNEKLLVGNGMVISPTKEAGVAGPHSMREMVQNINNEQDLYRFITDHSSNVPPTPAEIMYEKNSVRFPGVKFTPTC